MADAELDVGSQDSDQRVQPIGFAPAEPSLQLVGVQGVGPAGVACQERHRRRAVDIVAGWNGSTVVEADTGSPHTATSRLAQPRLAADAAEHLNIGDRRPSARSERVRRLRKDAALGAPA